MHSFVLCTALALAAGWVVVHHLPATAQADVAKVPASRTVQSVAFDGRALPLAMLRDVITTHPGDLVDADQLARDRAALAEALVARGYLAARVEPARVVHNAAGAFVTFAIEQGPPFHVRSVAVVGASELEAGVVTIAAGEVVRADRVERARAELAERLAARGKPGAVEARVTRDPAAAVVDIALVVTR